MTTNLTQTRSPIHPPRSLTSRLDVRGNATLLISLKMNHAMAPWELNVVDAVDVAVALLAMTKVDTTPLDEAPSSFYHQGRSVRTRF